MTPERTVEIVCKAEGDIVVGRVTTDKKLDALTIRSSIENTDRNRCPAGALIQDGRQLMCQRCHEPLMFRGADGKLFAANPGTVEIKP